MNSQTNIITSEERKASDAEVVLAMRALESAVHELMHMSDIAAEAFDNVFGPRNSIAPPAGESGQIYRVTDHESDQMAFLINNVAGRCSQLHKRFEAAWHGRKVA